MKHYEVIVIGGGHAGVEAASASARLGVSTALITMKRSDIGVMSCNPAIGGLGKGHLVREVDALDGLMGRVADRAGIQFRLLNRRKGPAVQGPRAQADRAIYRREMLAAVESQQDLEILEGEVAELAVEDGKIAGVFLRQGQQISAGAVVLTTGTFLRGTIHIGDVTHSGGRMGDDASVPLAEQIKSFNLDMGRLKTGTPPRLDGRTIDWNILGSQAGDPEPTLFSFMSKSVSAPQISCGITETNPETHKIIRANLSRSAMYGGQIEGVGPRYCPSIEDKIVRFADKDSHQVFLEPEGLDDHTVYPNGISTSLPADVQLDYVRSMRGLENVEIIQPGYAIEYDFVDPRALDMTLQLRTLPGLYLAGQINGTTGYEEAAAQGLVAGLNAGLASQGRPEEVFSRTDSYIGVMIDDLTTRGVTEPYRMFTSRAEFRLSLRADNADQRLTPRAIRLGCTSEKRRELFEEKSRQLETGGTLLRDKTYTTQDLAAIGKSINHDGVRRTPYQLLSFPDINFDDLIKLDPRLSSVEKSIRIQFERDALYANYLDRQMKDIAALQKDDRQKIPQDFDFHSVSGLSTELKDKLCRVRPDNLGQAARVDGITPAALTLILTHLRRNAERAA